MWAYVALAVVALFLLATGPVNDVSRFLVLLLLVALGAAWIELTRRQTLHEFPDAEAPDVFGDARARVSSWWDARRADRVAPAVSAQAPEAPVAGDVTARLGSLADLHARGALTDEEFAQAKARVLAGE